MRSYYNGIIIIFLIFISVNANAQNQGVKFFNGTWEEVLKKARIENKMIFLDVTAPW